MKLLATAFLLVYGVASAQTADPTTANFTLNQASISVSLEQKDFQTIYRTDQVPDTCYRSEVQGTTTQCHTEYDRQCHIETQQACGYRTYPVCQTVPRQVCSPPHEVCTTVNDSVCHGNPPVCQTVPRRVCHTEPGQCHTQMDSVCHNEQRYECHPESRQVCQDIPRQVCVQVPNVVQVPYACTRPVQVPIGQQLTLDTKAAVNVNLVNFAEVGQLADSFTAKLVDGQVTVSLAAPSTAYLYQVVSNDRTEQMISATEKDVTYTIGIQATSIQKLNAFQANQITNTKLFFDRLEFGFAGALNVPFKGHLKLVQHRAIFADSVIVDADFDSKAIVGQGATNVLAFNNFGITNPLNSKNHYGTLSLGIDLDALKKNALNPDAVNLIQGQGAPLSTDFNSYPSN